MADNNILVKSITDPMDLGEGPYWSEKDNCLYFVDAFAGFYCRYNPDEGRVSKAKGYGQTVTFIIPVYSVANTFIASHHQDIGKLYWNEAETHFEQLVSVESDHMIRFNDGKCDSGGNLWCGTMGMESSPGVVTPELGSLYCYSAGQKGLLQKRNKISLSNGIAWTNSNDRMFFVDSTARVVHLYDYDHQSADISKDICSFNLTKRITKVISNCTLGNDRIYLNWNQMKGCFKDDELPDGISIDAHNALWIASYNGGRILRFDIETGLLIIDQQIDFIL